MASKSEIETVMRRLLVLYGNPVTPSPDDYLDEVADSIASISILDLQLAIDAGRKEWKFFPRLAEIHEMVRKVRPPAPIYTSPNWEKAQQVLLTDVQKARHKALMGPLMEILKSSGKSSGEPSKLPDVSRDAFIKMQQDSSNEKLHGGPPRDQLSRKSLASGERDE